MGTSVFEHSWHGGFFGDPDVAAILSADAELARMIQVEAAYSRAIAAPDVAALIKKAAIDPDALRKGCASDGLPVPALVREFKRQIDEMHHAQIHKGLTSQDVMDTALILALREISALFDRRLSQLLKRLSQVDSRFGIQPLMGRTRMQAALPIKISDRIETWTTPLLAHQNRLSDLGPRLFQLQFGGAVGNRSASGAEGDKIAKAMANELELGNPPKAWHAMRENIVEFSGWMSLLTGTLGKMGQDISLLAQQGIDEIKLSGGGGSSAMPHKQNPVKAELLTSLARYNATQLSGMHHALIHEQERSGTAWALEWMILPQMLLATGRALNAAIELSDEIEVFGKN